MESQRYKLETQRQDLKVEPKAGKFGAVSVVVFGVVYIVMAFAVFYILFDADTALAGAAAVASIVVPMTIGFFVSELVHQRAGALAFVLVAAALSGAFAAWALAESEDFENRMDLIAPEADIPGFQPEPELEPEPTP